MKPTLIRDIDQPDNMVSTQRSQKLWRVDTPDGQRFVITSAACVMGRPETYVFPANEDGAVTNWLEADGSFAGDLDHDRAIAGYCEYLEEQRETLEARAALKSRIRSRDLSDEDVSSIISMIDQAAE
jgi:hypothetical protein